MAIRKPSAYRITNICLSRSKAITVSAFLTTTIICGYFVIQHLRYRTHQLIPTENYSATHLPMPARFQGKILPFHQVYETRVIGHYNGQFRDDYNKDFKVILLWTPWNTIRKTINYYFLRSGNKSFIHYGCPMSNCVAVHDRNIIEKAQVVLFHLLDVEAHDLPKYRRPDQVWILYNMEPPWLIEHGNRNLESLDGIFNLSMGYRSDSDIVMKYGFIDRDNTPQHAASELDDIWIKKTRSAIWIVSDCHTDGKREDYVQMLRKYIDVDIYGTCGEKKCFPAQSAACYEKLLVRYKFYLSFENAICEDYVSEKFFNVFNYDIVPVVFGGADYSKIAPPGSYIVANKFPNPQDLALEMSTVGSDDNLYVNYLRHKLPYKAFLDPWTCRLCEKLHILSTPTKIKNVKKWWISDSNCQRWNKTNKIFH